MFKAIYTEKRFFEKVKFYGAQAGKKLLYLAFQLYFMMQDAKVPASAKFKILGALAYFILPLDALPDFLPGLGYTDDFTVLLLAYKQVKEHLNLTHRHLASEKCKALFSTNTTDTSNPTNSPFS